jgi:hypothetical protein
MPTVNPGAGATEASLGGPVQLQRTLPGPGALPPPLTLPKAESPPGTAGVFERYTRPVGADSRAPEPVGRMRVQVPIGGGVRFTLATEPTSAELRVPLVNSDQFAVGVSVTAVPAGRTGGATPNTVGAGLHGEVRLDPSLSMSWQYTETWALSDGAPTRTFGVGATVKAGDVSVTPGVRFVDRPDDLIDRTEYSLTATAGNLRVTGSVTDRHGAPDGFGAAVDMTLGKSSVQLRVDDNNAVTGPGNTVLQASFGLRF